MRHCIWQCLNSDMLKAGSTLINVILVWMDVHQGWHLQHKPGCPFLKNPASMWTKVGKAECNAQQETWKKEGCEWLIRSV